MSNEASRSTSALQAWALTVMAGGSAPNPERVGEVDRAPGQAQYDPADVISVFMSARESAKQRHAQSRRRPPSAARNDVQPS